MKNKIISSYKSIQNRLRPSERQFILIGTGSRDDVICIDSDSVLFIFPVIDITQKEPIDELIGGLFPYSVIEYEHLNTYVQNHYYIAVDANSYIEGVATLVDRIIERFSADNWRLSMSEVMGFLK